MDGSTEVVDVPGGTWLAWLIGRVKATEKKTYLLNMEMIVDTSVKGKLRHNIGLLIEEVVPRARA